MTQISYLIINTRMYVLHSLNLNFLPESRPIASFSGATELVIIEDVYCVVFKHFINSRSEKETF